MDNTLLVSLSHQLAAYRSMDVIANNIANISTPAFKRESTKFEEYVSEMRPAEGELGTQPVSFVVDKGVTRDLTQGQIDQTNAPYDLAINGKGYFVIRTPGGNRYTRDGHFTLNAEGTLTTLDGNPVMSDGGAITITPDDGAVHIGADGIITGKQGQLGKIQLVTFANERALTKDGASLYSTTQTPIPAADATIQQGMLESSNVQPVVEITHMIEMSRAYEMTAALSDQQQNLLNQAVQKLGQMPSG